MKRFRGKTRLLAGVVVPAMLGWSVAAQANEAAEAQAADASASSAEGEIIVTGEKQQTTLQRAPLAITAIGADTLAQSNITQLIDMNGFVPGLTVANSGSFVRVPYTSYAQNIALVNMTGVRSRFVCAGAAVILLVLALFPKLSALVAAMHPSVLGGAALVLFGMVAASGIRSLAAAELDRSREDLIVVALSLGVGLIPTLSDRFFAAAPEALAPFTHSGVLLGILTAITLNIFLRPDRTKATSDRDTPETETPGAPTVAVGHAGG